MALPEFKLSVYPEDRAERLAKIMGQSSVAAHALTELRKRRANGEDVVLLTCGRWLGVGTKQDGSYSIGAPSPRQGR